MINISAGRLYFYLISLISFSIAFKEGYGLIFMRGKVVTVIGTIISIKTALPKLATFLYYVNGKKYISDNFIKVPMSAKIGDTKSIKVIIDRPQKLYNGSFTKLTILFLISILSLLIGIALK